MYLSGQQEPGGAVFIEVEGAVVLLRVGTVLLGHGAAHTHTSTVTAATTSTTSVC